MIKHDTRTFHPFLSDGTKRRITVTLNPATYELTREITSNVFIHARLTSAETALMLYLLDDAHNQLCEYDVAYETLHVKTKQLARDLLIVLNKTLKPLAMSIKDLPALNEQEDGMKPSYVLIVELLRDDAFHSHDNATN